MSGRSSIARAIASSSPSRISRLPSRVSGFSRVVPPGVKGTPPSALVSGAYSPLGSISSQVRPNTRLRYIQLLTSALLPWPGRPITSMFASLSTPRRVEDPRVIDERPAVHVAADVDAARAQARFGDGGVGGLEVSGGDLVGAALTRAPQPREPPRRGLRVLAFGERASPGALLGVRPARRAGARAVRASSSEPLPVVVSR